MRTFCAVRHAKDPKSYYGGLWSGNFYPALRELGHEIVESQTDLLPTSRFMHIASGFTREELEARARITEQILDEVRTAQRAGKVDLFLSYFYNSHFDPAGFDELRRLGIPSVNFYCNSIYQFEQVSAIAAKADFSWHAERDARASYLAVGANPVWVQMGADPSVYHPVEGVMRQSKACFVGQRYADRDRWLATLIKADVPVDIYGAGWGAASDQATPVQQVPAEKDYLGRRQSQAGTSSSYAKAVCEIIAQEGPARGVVRAVRQWGYRNQTRRLLPLVQARAKGRSEVLATTFAGYEVCLNFSNVWADGRSGSNLIPHVRLRDFEAPMCRACYLTGHTDEITEFYDVGREIDTYRTSEELVDKTKFYLKNAADAEGLRDAGYLRAKRDHTWGQRFRELFGKIELRGGLTSAR